MATEKKMEAIYALPPEERYAHFVKEAAGFGEVWGLYNEGWALLGTSDGQTVVPLWPEREYAQRFAEGEWADYQPESIPLDDFLDDLLPLLEGDGIVPGVLYSPDGKGITPSIAQLRQDLEDEYSQYL